MAFLMKQKILIALDGERDSEWAFDWYCNNLHRPGNNVIIVSCSEIGVKLATIAPEAVLNEDETSIEVFIEEENKILAEKVSKYQKKLRSAMLVGKVLTSCHTSPSEVILNTATTEEVNMIIIGSKGCSLNRQGVGSVCNYLISHSIIPVIVCKHPDAVNDGYVSKYVVDPKTLRLIPRRSSQSSAEPENSPVASATSSRPKVEEDNASPVQTTDRRIQSRSPDVNVPTIDTSNVHQVKNVSEDLNNDEAQESHISEESDESISTEITINGLLSEEVEITESAQSDVGHDDVNNDKAENITTKTPVDNTNLQSLDDNGNKDSKVQKDVPMLSTKDVSILLSTRLNKSSRIGTSTSSETFNSNQEEDTVTSTASFTEALSDTQ